MNKLTMIITTVALAILVALSVRLWAVTSDLNAISVQAEQQTVLINRALGKIIPYTLPPKVEADITAIEKHLGDESKPHMAAADIQKLNEQLRSVVNDLPPWAQEEVLPRIVPIRWELEALWVLSNKPSNDETSITTHIKATESLLSQKPISDSDKQEKRLDKLEENLKKQQELLDLSLANIERASVLEKAKRAIEGKENAEAAASLLGAYEDKEAKELSAKLGNVILVRSISNDFDSAEKELGKYEALQDATLKEYAIGRAYQTIMDFRLRMAASDLTNPELTKKLGGLEKRIAKGMEDIIKGKQARDAEKLKAYQKWALQQIKSVHSYRTLREIELGKVIPLHRHNPATNAYKNAEQIAANTARDELIKYMSSINQGLLDEAVALWFRKTYQRCFEELNEGRQFEVITGFAIATKKGLE